jgi:hypothetical protein
MGITVTISSELPHLWGGGTIHPSPHFCVIITISTFSGCTRNSSPSLTNDSPASTLSHAAFSRYLKAEANPSILRVRQFGARESDAIRHKLDVLCRFVLILCGVEQRPPCEAALLLGISKHAVDVAPRCT